MHVTMEATIISFNVIVRPYVSHNGSVTSGEYIMNLINQVFVCLFLKQSLTQYH